MLGLQGLAGHDGADPLGTLPEHDRHDADVLSVCPDRGHRLALRPEPRWDFAHLCDNPAARKDDGEADRRGRGNVLVGWRQDLPRLTYPVDLGLRGRLDLVRGFAVEARGQKEVADAPENQEDEPEDEAVGKRHPKPERAEQRTTLAAASACRVMSD